MKLTHRLRFRVPGKTDHKQTVRRDAHGFAMEINGGRRIDSADGHAALNQFSLQFSARAGIGRQSRVMIAPRMMSCISIQTNYGGLVNSPQMCHSRAGGNLQPTEKHWIALKLH